MSLTSAEISQPPLSAAELYDLAPCGLLTVGVDGRIVSVNQTFAAWTGTPVSSLVGSPLPNLLEAGARTFFETRLLPVVRAQGEVRELALSFTGGDNEILPALINAAIDQKDQVELVHLAVFDASARQAYERELLAAQRNAEHAEARTRILQDASTAFIESDTVETLAHALARIARAATGADAAAVFINDDEPRLVAGVVPIDAALLAPRPPEGQNNTALRSWSTKAEDPDPQVKTALEASGLETMLAAPLARDSQISGTLMCYFSRDPEMDEQSNELLVSLCRQAAQALARLQLQAQLAAIALYDPLTGLANRVLLRSHITTSVETALTKQQPLALIFVDLDDFKSVNDELGHSAGDTVLTVIANRLTAAVRTDDLVCRFGGDEFIVVCQDTTKTQALIVAERIRNAIKQPIPGDGWHRTITASVGVTTHATTTGHSLTGPELLRTADLAMYRAKDHGKDRVSLITYD